MSLTRRHPLNLLKLRIAQVRACQHEILIDQRQLARALLERREVAFQQQLKQTRQQVKAEVWDDVWNHASAYGSWRHVWAIEKLDELEAQATVEMELAHQLVCQRIRAVIDRLDFGPIEVIEGGRTNSEQRNALHCLAFFATLADAQLVDAAELDAALAIDFDFVPSPPGFAIRKSPHRPGAPSYPLHLTH